MDTDPTDDIEQLRDELGEQDYEQLMGLVEVALRGIASQHDIILTHSAVGAVKDRICVIAAQQCGDESRMDPQGLLDEMEDPSGQRAIDNVSVAIGWEMSDNPTLASLYGAMIERRQRAALDDE